MRSGYGHVWFSVAAYEHILAQNTSPDILEVDSEGAYHNLIGDRITDAATHRFLKSKAIAGFDNDITMVRIGAMNLMLHSIDNPQFRYTDPPSKAYMKRGLKQHASGSIFTS